MGGALGVAMYCYLGYYQICYLGDEVADPSRTIPRSIAISVAAVGAIYLAMTLGILGVIPWREVGGSGTLVSDFIDRLRGPFAARLLTVMVMWTAVAGCFAALLGYSRIPYAAARSGHFFRALARTHPTGDFPHVSLLVLGALATLACLGDLGSVIDALLTSRILIQFVAQILTVLYLRTRPSVLARMPFRMALYPLPAMAALGGWLWVFGTTSRVSIVYGLASLVIGVGAFAVWDREIGRGRGPDSEP
jgi:amino acid transporter